MKKRDFYLGILVINAPLVLVLLVLNVLVFIGKINASLGTVIALSLLALAIGNVLYFFYVDGIRKSMETLTFPLDKLANGEVNASFQFRRKSLLNFELLNKRVVTVFTNMQLTLSYIDKIISGDLNAEHKLLSDKDVLGHKLIELNKNLRNSKIELEKSQAEDEKRNWVANGLAKFSDILRREHKSMTNMGYDIVSNIIDYIQFNQGALFVLNEDNEKDIYYELLSAVAYGREKKIEDKIRLGEALVGRCAYEQKTIYMTEIPSGYINITSGLGDASPNNLLIVPCMLDDKVFGVIELASFRKIEPYKIEFIEKIGESIASSIANVRNREHTNTLLAASQHQSEELAAQEEELRQNLEEMEATQEDLKRQMDLNAELRREMENEKFMFDVMLDKIPARVVFKDRQCRFIKASKSAAAKFGRQSYHELIGLSDADLLNPEFAKKTMADERQIMDSRKGMYNFIEHEILPNGDSVWKSVSKVPMITEKDQCIGIFGIIFDITDFKKAEVESERHKNNFNQLFEAINDALIKVSLNLNGEITDVNQLFCSVFEISPDQVKGHSFNNWMIESKADNQSFDLSKIIAEGQYSAERNYLLKNKKIGLKEHYVLIEKSKDDKEIYLFASLI